MATTVPESHNLKVDLSTFDNSWYETGTPFTRLLWYFCNALFFKTLIPFPSSFKRWLLVLFGAKVGVGLVIKPDVNIKYPWLLEVGDNVWIGEGAWIDNLAFVKLGSNVCVSQGAYLLTGNHDFKKTTFDLIVKPITLEDGSWVGAKSVVCPGVTMKTHAILTVGSVLTKDAEAYMICSGNPATPIRERQLSRQ